MITYTLSETNRLTPLKTGQARPKRKQTIVFQPHPFSGANLLLVSGSVTCITLPETNIAPKNQWLEYYFPIGEAYFQGLC